MSRLAIITARGGSKRIPKKNIRDFCGKPILAYSIEAALSSRLFACCIYPTAPFVTAEKLKAAVEQLEASDADTLIPVVSFSYPPQRAMVVEQERLVFKYPEYLDSRSQDLQPHYHDVGQFYVFRTDRFAVNKKLMVGNILPLIVSELEVQDIDNLTDWKIAEMKYRLMTEEK